MDEKSRLDNERDLLNGAADANDELQHQLDDFDNAFGKLRKETGYSQNDGEDTSNLNLAQSFFRNEPTSGGVNKASRISTEYDRMLKEQEEFLKSLDNHFENYNVDLSDDPELEKALNTPLPDLTRESFLDFETSLADIGADDFMAEPAETPAVSAPEETAPVVEEFNPWEEVQEEAPVQAEAPAVDFPVEEPAMSINVETPSMINDVTSIASQFGPWNELNNVDVKLEGPLFAEEGHEEDDKLQEPLLNVEPVELDLSQLTPASVGPLDLDLSFVPTSVNEITPEVPAVELPVEPEVIEEPVHSYVNEMPKVSSVFGPTDGIRNVGYFGDEEPVSDPAEVVKETEDKLLHIDEQFTPTPFEENIAEIKEFHPWEEDVYKPAEVTEEPVSEPAETLSEAPVEQPEVIEEPAYAEQEPVFTEEPAAETPAYEEAPAEEPTIEEPVTEEPVYAEPEVAEVSTYEEQEPVIEETVTEEPESEFKPWTDITAEEYEDEPEEEAIDSLKDYDNLDLEHVYQDITAQLNLDEIAKADAEYVSNEVSEPVAEVTEEKPWEEIQVAEAPVVAEWQPEEDVTLDEQVSEPVEGVEEEFKPEETAEPVEETFETVEEPVEEVTEPETAPAEPVEETFETEEVTEPETAPAEETFEIVAEPVEEVTEPETTPAEEVVEQPAEEAAIYEIPDFNDGEEDFTAATAEVLNQPLPEESDEEKLAKIVAANFVVNEVVNEQPAEEVNEPETEPVEEIAAVEEPAVVEEPVEVEEPAVVEETVEEQPTEQVEAAAEAPELGDDFDHLTYNHTFDDLDSYINPEPIDVTIPDYEEIMLPDIDEEFFDHMEFNHRFDEEDSHVYDEIRKKYEAEAAVEQPSFEEPVNEEQQQPVEEHVEETPVVEEPVITEEPSVTEEPVVEEPVVTEEPVIEEPVQVEMPLFEETPAETVKPVEAEAEPVNVEQPVYTKPVVEEPEVKAEEEQNIEDKEEQLLSMNDIETPLDELSKVKMEDQDNNINLDDMADLFNNNADNNAVLENIDDILSDVKSYNIEQGIRNDENTQVNIISELNKEIEAETKQPVKAEAKKSFLSGFFSVNDDDDELAEVKDEDAVRKASIAAAISQMGQYTEEYAGDDEEYVPPVQPQKVKAQEPVARPTYYEDASQINELTQRIEKERVMRQEMFDQTQQLKLQVSEYESELNTVNSNMSRTNKILNVVLTLLIIALFVILIVIGFFFAQERGLI